MIDLQLLSEAGGQMLVNKIPNPVQQLKFHTGMYDDIQAGSLLVVDCRLIDNLRDASVRAVTACTYKRTGLLLLVDQETLDSSEQLVELNLCLRSMWASTTMVLKPWTERTGDNIRTQDRYFSTAAIPFIADMITMAVGKLPKLLESQTHFMCLHKSGKVVANGPRAPPTPNQEVMISTEVDSYLKAVHEASTGEEAIALWRPGLFQPIHLKRLQHGPKQGKGHKGGSQGQGHKST